MTINTNEDATIVNDATGGLQQPLLPVRSTIRNPAARGTTRTPPRHAFQIRNRTATEEGQPGAQQTYYDDDYNTEVRVDAREIAVPQSVQYYEEPGANPPVISRSAVSSTRSFARDPSFWLLRLPLVFLIGAMTRIGIYSSLKAIKLVLSQWFNCSVQCWMEPDDDALPWKSRLSWVYTTVTGGFLCGCLQACLLPSSQPRSIRNCRTPSLPQNMIPCIYDAADCWQQWTLTVLSSIVALSTGAPLGPEILVLSIGALAAGFLIRVVPRLQSTGISSRHQVLLVQSGMAAAVGSIFSAFPLVGPLLVTELFFGSNLELELDSESSMEGSPLANIDGTQVELTDLDESSSSHSLERQSLPSRFGYMESLVLQSCATVSTLLIGRLLPGPSMVEVVGFLAVGINLELWHWAAAVPLGLVGGIVGLTIHALTRALQSSKQSIETVMTNRMGSSPWLPVLLFPTLGGLLHGLISIFDPLAVGSGIDLASRIWSDVISNEDETLAVYQLLMVALAKIVGLSMSLACGLVGGLLVPAGVVGLLVGAALASVVEGLPFALALPCCMTACVVSASPIPLSVTAVTILTLSGSVDDAGPILISSLIGWTVSNGLGNVRRGRTQSQTLRESNVSLEAPGGEEEPLPSSDDEILRDVRAAIFCGT